MEGETRRTTKGFEVYPVEIGMVDVRFGLTCTGMNQMSGDLNRT